MSVVLNPYLNFRDNARQAMEFYRSVFGGELRVNTFKEYDACQDPAEDDLIMHAQLDGEHGVTLMGSDTPPRMGYKGHEGFSVSLSGDDERVLSGWFEKLADGGTITMPLDKAPWGDSFGMCVDRFGITWLVNISGSG